jgi:hypothetical protein
MGAAKVTKGIGVRRAWLGCLAGLGLAASASLHAVVEPESHAWLVEVDSSDTEIHGLCFGDGVPRASLVGKAGMAKVESLALYLKLNPDNSRDLRLLVADANGGVIKDFAWPESNETAGATDPVDVCNLLSTDVIKPEKTLTLFDASRQSGPARPNGLSISRNNELYVGSSSNGNGSPSEVWRFALDGDRMPVLIDGAVTVDVGSQKVAATIGETLAMRDGSLLVLSSKPAAIIRYDAPVAPCTPPKQPKAVCELPSRTVYAFDNSTPSGMARAFDDYLLVSMTDGRIRVLKQELSGILTDVGAPLDLGDLVLGQGQNKIKVINYDFEVYGDTSAQSITDLYVADGTGSNVYRLPLLLDEANVEEPIIVSGTPEVVSEGINSPAGLAALTVTIVDAASCTDPADPCLISPSNLATLPKTSTGSLATTEYSIPDTRHACGCTGPICGTETVETSEPGDGSLKLKEWNRFIPKELCGIKREGENYPIIEVAEIDSRVGFGPEFYLENFGEAYYYILEKEDDGSGFGCHRPSAELPGDTDSEGDLAYYYPYQQIVVGWASLTREEDELKPGGPLGLLGFSSRGVEGPTAVVDKSISCGSARGGSFFSLLFTLKFADSDTSSWMRPDYLALVDKAMDNLELTAKRAEVCVDPRKDTRAISRRVAKAQRAWRGKKDDYHLGLDIIVQLNDDLKVDLVNNFLDPSDPSLPPSLLPLAEQCLQAGVAADLQARGVHIEHQLCSQVLHPSFGGDYDLSRCDGFENTSP